MFEKSPDERLSAWSEHRHYLDSSKNPLDDLIEYWSRAPYVPYNRLVDPYNQYNWPTPWEIIIENKYDDFTKSLLMAWTLKLTDKFKASKIEIKTYTDSEKNRQYNIVVVEDTWVINYNDNTLNLVTDIPSSFHLENLIEVQRPR